jgi:hypothetical protein
MEVFDFFQLRRAEEERLKAERCKTARARAAHLMIAQQLEERVRLRAIS